MVCLVFLDPVPSLFKHCFLYVFIFIFHDVLFQVFFGLVILILESFLNFFTLSFNNFGLFNGIITLLF